MTALGWRRLIGLPTLLPLLLVSIAFASQLRGLVPTNKGDAQSGVATPIATVVLPDTVWDLDHLAVDDSVWFVSGTNAEARLYRTGAGAEAQSWPLPQGEYSGVHHTVKNTGDGEIVLNADYELVRFDRSASAIATITFDLKVDGALPGALDPADPLPGTWISAFFVDGDRILVARNKIPYLTIVDAAEFEVTGRIGIPDDYAGARGVVARNGRIYLLGDDGSVLQLEANGSIGPTSRIAASKVLLVDGEPIAVAREGPASRVLDLRRSEPLSGLHFSVASEDSGRVIGYDRFTGSVTLLDHSGQLLLQVRLPKSTGPGRKGDSCPLIQAITASNDGTVWYSTSNDRTVWTVHSKPG